MAATITDRQSRIQIFKDVTSNTITSLSSGMFSLALGLMLLDRLESPISFGIEMLITPLVSLLLMAKVGSLVDRLPHKKLIVISMFARLAALVAFALTIDHFSGERKLIPVAIFIAVNAAASQITSTTYSASVHELVNAAYLQRLSALTQSASAASSILSPILGAGLYAWVGFDAFIDFEMIASVLAFVILLTMKFHESIDHDPQKASATPKESRSFKKLAEYLKQRPVLKDLILISAMANFLLTAFNIGMPYLIVSQLKAGNQLVGILESGISVGILAASSALSLIKTPRHFTLKVLSSLLLIGACTAGFGVLAQTFQNLTQLHLIGFIIMLILGLGVALVNVTVTVYQQTTVPTRLLGRLFSLSSTMSTAIVPIATLIYTALFEKIKPGAVIFIASGTLMVVIVLVWSIWFRRDATQDQKTTIIKD